MARARSARCAMLMAAALGLFAACEAEKAPVEAEAAPEKPSIGRFGAALSQRPIEDLAGLLREPARFAGKTVAVEGHVRRACTKKGCWMELATGTQAGAPGCRVTFLDYAFFVPTDSAGSRARVEAKVELSTLKPSHVRHLEEEGATFASKAEDGSAQEVRLVATGVELTRAGG